MKLGIMGAMPEETSGIVDLLENAVTQTIGGREYHVGRCHGIDVAVAFSRWGKVAASATATALFTHFGVDGILFVGVAGAIDPSLRPGDIVVADEMLQYDMDASEIPPFRRFEVPLLGRSRFPTHKAWAAAAKAAAADFLADELDAVIGRDMRLEFFSDDPRIVSGLVASGDRFIGNAKFAEHLRKVLPDLLCVEMEGAAVAQVCFEFDRPYAVIRIVSDRADHNAPVDFGRFVSRISAVMSSRIVDRFLCRVAESDHPRAISRERMAASVPGRDPSEGDRPKDQCGSAFDGAQRISNLSAQDVIRILGLKSHPEGGHYRETFRDEQLDSNGRAVSTAILFLLKAGEVSAWHRVDASELWHYHAGAPLRLATTQDGQEVRIQYLGLDPTREEMPQIAVPADHWQTARSLGEWTLVSCTVAPGFLFSKFELAPPGWEPAAETSATVLPME